MIAAWMLGTTVFALLLCVAAFSVDRILRMTRRPTRTPWAVALILAVVWPLMAPLVLTPQRPAVSEIPMPIPMQQWSPADLVAAQLPSQTNHWEQRAATLLLVVWAVFSAVMVIRLVIAARVLARVTRSAKRMQVDGESVLVTESLGPAVVGLWTPHVAVPEWFMHLDGSLRKMVLRHEREHCKSRDPQLVWLASLAIAIMPWNIGIWVLSRRLRLALEIDCDARTLRRDADSTKYGKLLLLIAQRQSSYPLASMLAESTSHLSRRITAMQMRPLRKPAVRIVLFSAVAAGAIGVACSPRVASDLTGPGAKPISATAAKLEAEKMAPGTVYFESQVEKPVAAAPGSTGPTYPADLKARSVEGRVLAMFVVNESGLAEPATLKVLKADDPAFAQSVIDALPTMRFTAAEIGGRKVKQMVQQPFMFALSEAGRKPSAIIGEYKNQALAPERNQPEIASANGAMLRAPTVKPGSTPTKSFPTQGDTKTLRGRDMPAHVPGQPYFESQVDKPAGVGPDYKGAEYPSDLKAKGVEGTVLAMFVVNEDGTPDMSSFKVLRTDNQVFDASVRKAVADARFTPAMLDGVAVKQLVQQPFRFSLSR